MGLLKTNNKKLVSLKAALSDIRNSFDKTHVQVSFSENKYRPNKTYHLVYGFNEGAFEMLMGYEYPGLLMPREDYFRVSINPQSKTFKSKSTNFPGTEFPEEEVLSIAVFLMENYLEKPSLAVNRNSDGLFETFKIQYKTRKVFYYDDSSRPGPPTDENFISIYTTGGLYVPPGGYALQFHTDDNSFVIQLSDSITESERYTRFLYVQVTNRDEKICSLVYDPDRNETREFCNLNDDFYTKYGDEVKECLRTVFASKEYLNFFKGEGSDFSL